MSHDDTILRLREEARSIFEAGVEAADPHRAVVENIRTTDNGGLLIAGQELSQPGQLKIVAIGKASCTMAAAAIDAMKAGGIREELLSTPGMVVVNRENARELSGFEVLATGHPLPNEAGVRAAERIETYLAGGSADQGILVLISGGGSALLPAPAAGLPLEDKRAVTELLLRGGADIREFNTVRKHLSRLKGGGLARIAAPAPTEVLILSDVFDDDLSAIASGPAVPDPTTFDDAIEILKRYEIWKPSPEAIKQHLESGARGHVEETPKPGNAIFENVQQQIIGSNAIRLKAATERARELGYELDVLAEPLTGEAREVAGGFSDVLRKVPRKGGSRRRCAYLAGGETTVTLRGSGKGGRNQEMALAIAAEAAGKSISVPWVFLSGGTDGRDGPTDAAGGVVDAKTIKRGEQGGDDPHRALRDNDSYAFLRRSGDLLMTGGTGTNVADLQVLLYELE